MPTAESPQWSPWPSQGRWADLQLREAGAPEGERGRQRRAGVLDLGAERFCVCVAVSRDLGGFMNVSLAFGEAEGPTISAGFKVSIFWGDL